MLLQEVLAACVCLIAARAAHVALSRMVAVAPSCE